MTNIRVGTLTRRGIDPWRLHPDALRLAVRIVFPNNPPDTDPVPNSISYPQDYLRFIGVPEQDIADACRFYSESDVKSASMAIREFSGRDRHTPYAEYFMDLVKLTHAIGEYDVHYLMRMRVNPAEALDRLQHTYGMKVPLEKLVS